MNLNFFYGFLIIVENEIVSLLLSIDGVKNVWLNCIIEWLMLFGFKFLDSLFKESLRSV